MILKYLFFFGLSAFAMVCGVEAQEKLAPLQDVDAQGRRASTKAQQKIHELDRETMSLQQSYLQLRHEVVVMEHYQTQLRQQKQQLEQALQKVEERRQQYRESRMQLAPLVRRMTEVLAQWVTLDLPFLATERHARQQELQRLQEDALVDNDQRLERLLNAYQIELSYGYSVEHWAGKLATGRYVDFLRVGRMYLYYLTNDRQQGAVWRAGSWQPLTADTVAAVAEAIEMLGAGVEPELIALPLESK